MKFKQAICFLTIIFLISITVTVFSQDAEIVEPIDHFGFKPGTDRELITYEELIDYLNILDENSEKLKMIEIGKSPFGKPIYICFVSSPENIANLDELKTINRSLMLDTEIPDQEREEIIEKGKVFVLATLSMHSKEVGPSQSAPLIAYDLITTSEINKLTWLDDVVYMMVPCHNPDGMDMIVEHYKKYKDTKYEGSSMPGVYHKYVGHDNNRDFVTLTQTDTKAIASIYNLEWFPQVMVEKHQMGSRGVRYFVPPPHDPIAENIDAGIWNWIGIFGSNMITDMTKDGLAGVSQHYLFDEYWPGSTGTCQWKNVIGMLTEAASVQVAKPIYIEPNELTVRGKGLSEYKKSVNMPLPWEGGWWRLGDIIDYEVSSTMSILKTASNHRTEILEFINDLCRREVEKGKTEAPYYYVMPLNQNDQGELVGIVNLLKEHGINVYQLNHDLIISNVIYGSGDIVVPMAQPFRPFIKEVLEDQEFPLRHYTPDGEIIKPYDVTSWSLPLHRGVQCIEINIRSTELENSLTEITDSFNLNKEEIEYNAIILPANNNESYRAAFMAMGLGLKVFRLADDVITDEKEFKKGSFYIERSDKLNNILQTLTVSPVFLKSGFDYKLNEINMPRIGLTESWFHDMDAGWTRYVLDEYHIPFTILRPADFETTDLKDNFDIVIFPNVSKNVLMDGKYKSGSTYYISSYPPEYTKGMGEIGMEKLMEFLDGGGIIVSWGRSTQLFDTNLKIKHSEDDNEEFKLPFKSITNELKEAGLYCPGPLIKVNIKQNHPLTYGLEKDAGILFKGSQVFSTSIPKFDMDRRVIAVFPEKDILLSGYCENEKKLANKTAMVWLKKGKGQIVLMGFSPQFRASTQGTYKLLFNSILLESIK